MDKSPNRISQSPLLKGALGIGLVVGGMALEARFQLLQQLGGKKAPAVAQAPEVQPAPAPEAAPVVVAEAPDPDAGLMKEADVPENLKAAHAIVRNNPELLAWYRKTLEEWKTELQTFRDQVAAVTNERAFGVGAGDFRFREKEMEERRATYVALVEARIAANETHLLAMMTAAGMEENPDVARRMLLTQTPGYQAHVDLSAGGLYGFNVAGLAERNEDKKKLFSHGISENGKATLKMDLNDTYEEPEFHNTITHEEFHGMLQAPRHVGKQKFNQYNFADAPELLDGPIIPYKENIYLQHEALYEGITELLACQTSHLEGNPDDEPTYRPLVVDAVLLSSVNRQALMSWYTGMMTTEDAYNALRGSLVDRGVPDAEAVAILNRAFEDKGHTQNEGNAAWSLAFALQRATKQDLPTLVKSQNLPPEVAKLLESYDIGTLRTMTLEELSALCEQETGYSETIGDRRIGASVSTIGLHVYAHDKKNGIALSAFAAGLGRDNYKAQNIVKKAERLSPNSAAVQRRIGYAHDGFKGSDSMSKSSDYKNKDYAQVVAAWERALELDPSDNDSRFELAVIKLKRAVADTPEGGTPDEATVNACLEQMRASLKDPARQPSHWLTQLYDLCESTSGYSSTYSSWERAFRPHQALKDRIKKIRDEAKAQK